MVRKESLSLCLEELTSVTTQLTYNQHLGQLGAA
jgi:hypothetical protein